MAGEWALADVQHEALHAHTTADVFIDWPTGFGWFHHAS
jgi:hypothetical protein